MLDKAANSVKGIASAALSKILSGDDTATGVEGSCSDNSDRHPTSSQDQPVASAVGIDRDGNGAVAPVDEVIEIWILGTVRPHNTLHRG